MCKILIICGPTATGKTKLAFDLTKRFNAELISADSRQIYKDLDVVTGKDIPKNTEVKIWMYDVVDADERFSVSQYRKFVMPIIFDIEKRRKLPIIVGGTGLYIDAIVKPFETIHVPLNRNTRTELTRVPIDGLQQKLKKLDQVKWQHMNQSDRHNPRRLIRAIEVALWKKQHGTPEEKNVQEFDALWIGLTMPMDKLSDKISRRVIDRWEQGAIDEVRRYPTASALGIKDISLFLDETISESEAKRRWTMEEVAYAKRQMTWFKKKKQIRWFDVSKKGYESAVEAIVSAWYTGIRDGKN